MRSGVCGGTPPLSELRFEASSRAVGPAPSAGYAAPPLGGPRRIGRPTESARSSSANFDVTATGAGAVVGSCTGAWMLRSYGLSLLGCTYGFHSASRCARMASCRSRCLRSHACCDLSSALGLGWESGGLVRVFHSRQAACAEAGEVQCLRLPQQEQVLGQHGMAGTWWGKIGKRRMSLQRCLPASVPGCAPTITIFPPPQPPTPVALLAT